MNKGLIYPEREALLQMPASVNGWIVLRDYAYHFGDLEIFRKKYQLINFQRFPML